MTPEVLPTSFDTLLVAVSILVSFCGAYAALASAAHIRSADGTVNPLNALLAGVALGGVGIWSMHFLGMEAWKTGLAVGYGAIGTVLSLLVAVLASAVALGYMAAAHFSWQRLAVAGPLAGLGVSAMHFLGMDAMRFGGFLEWHVGRTLLAVLIAVVAATAALWLAFHVRSAKHRVAAAAVMALAVCAMHYTGMAAADVVCTTTDRYARIAGLLYSDDMKLLVGVVGVGIALMVGLDALLQRITQTRDSLSSR